MVGYLERRPRPELAGVVRTVWIQRTAAAPYVQRHLPSGGVELHFPIGGRPRFLGPLTGAEVELVPPYTTIIGVRFRPGTAPPLPAALDDLVDQRLDLTDLWGGQVDRLAGTVAAAGSPEQALAALQAHLLRQFRGAAPVDRLVREAVTALMPWAPVHIDALATDLALSPSQLRRRCLQAVGLTPKVLQRMLRFQGFLALAQAGGGGVATLAVDAGYADQAHLARECQRLTGLTPRQFLGGNREQCACGHDHAASYESYLTGRARFVQERRSGRP